ncbi:MAG: hypothetical protein RL488_477 [Actinomycetota bacterium]|jgi:methionyl-tRNA formyltransferase
MEPIIFAGTPENAATTLRELVRNGFQIALVITRLDAPVGRKRVLTPSAVAQVATELGLPILKTNRITPENEETMRQSGARLAVVVAFGALLKKSTIDLLGLGWFNLHYSVLPRWRGASPVQSAILAGDNSTGVSLFKIDEGLDTGDLVGVVETVIEPGENTQRLLTRLTDLGVSLALQELPRLIAGIATLSAQAGSATIAKKTTRADARLLPGDTAATALAKVLAYNPEPMAWIEVNGQPLRILEATHSLQAVTPGALELTKQGVLLGLADGKAIELLLVQPAGKNQMAANDWFRGTKESERVIS